jgi:hypothetical protein
MKRQVWFLGLLVLTAGCATGYSLVRATEEVTVGPYRVAPQAEWSSIRGGRGVLWTVDGPGLELLYFADPMHDGEALFVKEAKAKVPRFRAGMTATEVSELIADSFAAAGSKQVVIRGLAPRPFAGMEGFGFELEFLSDAGLERRALVAGIERDGVLYVVIFNAARQYYYDKYLEAVQRILSSLRLTEGTVAG